MGGVDRNALEKNLRELIGQRLAMPTLRVDQWIRFGLMPEPVAKELGADATQPGLIMELRGYTLRDRPLYYQTVYAGAFGDRLVIARENGK